MSDDMKDSFRVYEYSEWKQLFEKSKRRYLEIDAEWKALGFWQKIRRGREFQVRFETVMATIRYMESKKKEIESSALS